MKSNKLPPATKPVADFKPATNGFKFENYGNDDGITNLTIAEVRRMFGEQVCASLEGGRCTLTPAAQRWMETTNKGMSGGHCEGLAALSLLMERGQIDPKLFGAPTVYGLEIKDNEHLQREVAYWFATQAVMPMADAEDKKLTPNQVVDKIQKSLKGGDAYTLGIYGPGYSQGHATTPYGIVDKGKGIIWIMHYDNNYPGEEKAIEVNRKANTWAYKTASDPNAGENEYKGDATTFTLTLAPTSVRTGPLLCHFCGDVDASEETVAKGSKKGAAPDLRQITLDGDAELLITDEAGKRLGHVGDQIVNEIPGAFFAADRSGASDVDDEPSYFVPGGKKVAVSLSNGGKRSTESDVSLLGRGYELSVEGVKLDPGQKDEISFSGDFSLVTYTTKRPRTPMLSIGVETSTADYELEVKVRGHSAGQHVELGIDLKKGTFSVKVKGDAGDQPTLGIKLIRIDDSGEKTFAHKAAAPASDQTMVLDYARWKGDKAPLHVSVLSASGAVVSEEDEGDED